MKNEKLYLYAASVGNFSPRIAIFGETPEVACKLLAEFLEIAKKTKKIKLTPEKCDKITVLEGWK